MSQTPIYTEYHPRWYRRRPSTYWWLRKPSYLAFILRELSSLFVAWFVVFTLLQIYALKQGTENSYQRFLEWTRNPIVFAVNFIAFFFVVFHAITWFKLAPQAMVVRMNGKRVPAAWIAGSNYAAWAVASVVVAWIVLRS
jgi:fumarate reductase subunit C